jgi:hypothetical protein
MTQISIRAPEQTSRFNISLVAVLGTAVGALAGLLAFAPFFAPITG